MKKYIPHILSFVVGGIICIGIYRLFVPKPKPEYKVNIERLEKVASEYREKINTQNKLIKELNEKSNEIEVRYETIIKNPVPNHVGDSLARLILARYSTPKP